MSSIGPIQSMPFRNAAKVAVRSSDSTAAAGVRGAQNVLGRRADRGLEREPELFSVSVQPMTAARQADAIDLQAMAEPGLADVATGFEVVDQGVEVLVGLVIEFADEPGHDPAEQHSTEPGRRVGRQHHLAERDASRRRNGPRVVRLENRHRH